MYDLKNIYRRLRENYAGYDISCEDGILRIAMPWGNAVAKGLDFSFWAEGEPIDKGRAENEEELYGILERFILRSLPGMKAADPQPGGAQSGGSGGLFVAESRRRKWRVQPYGEAR